MKKIRICLIIFSICSILAGVLDFAYQPSFFNFLMIGVMSSFMLSIYRTGTRQHYTFWFLSSASIFYLFWRLLANINHPVLLSVFSLSIFLFFVTHYFLKSPLYYPRVWWWEYDFRYRKDLTVDVSHNQSDLKGRLVDYRNKLACLVVFEPLEVGQEISIKENRGKMRSWTGKIKTEVPGLRGRGFRYGVELKL